MNTRIPIRDIMSTEPRKISPDATAHEAARRMKEAGVGSLLVSTSSTLLGIITESDLMKVVSADKRPSTVRVKELMTPDPVTVAPETDIHDAMKTMARLGIRRLPVVVGGDIVGMVTQNDITRVSPMLLEVIREWERAYGEREPEEVKEAEDEPFLEGICANCETAKDNLRLIDGELYCPECRDEEFGGEVEAEGEAEPTPAAGRPRSEIAATD